MGNEHSEGVVPPEGVASNDHKPLENSGPLPHLIPPLKTSRILMVEDDESILRIMTFVMREAGYEVLQARDGEEGLAIATQHLREIDLLVTDQVMPLVSGKELADKLLRKRADLKIIITSGYQCVEIIEPGEENHRIHFLQKPYGIDAFLSKIREVMNGEV